MDRRVRPLAAAVLLAATLGLCVHYGATYEAGWPYPTGEQLTTDYANHVGERALVFGEVRSTNEEGAVVRVLHSPGALTTDLVVAGEEAATLADAEPGSAVQVYGTLEADRRMVAEAVVIERNPGETAYATAASLVGIAVAVGSVARHWRVNGRELRIEAR